MDPQTLPVKIEVVKQLPIDELDARLRNVRLRGFPDVKIYESADIEIKEVSPESIRTRIFTPQPRVYRTFIQGIEKMAEMFAKEGIDMFRLGTGYDYSATYADGQTCNWTLIPPVVEVLPIVFNKGKGLDYSGLIGEELRKVMDKKGFKENPELNELDFPEFEPLRGGTHFISEICDGSNRVHSALERGINQHLLFIDGPIRGYPYYAAPKPYSTVHVESERVDGSKSDKVHVLTDPGHKELYRLFPSGGIHTGDVRPDKK